MKKLTDILKNTPVREVCGDTAAAIGGLVYDSRAVKPGDCFFAVPGTQSDGHDYIPMAVEKGAAAIVCERMPADAAEGVAYVLVGDSAGAMADMAAAIYDYPSRELKLVGITGTNGKTTTATLLYDLVRAMEADAPEPLSVLNVDGGASANDFLMQFQADVLRCNLQRPQNRETTAMGAAYLAGLATGFWSSTEELEALRSADDVYRPGLEDARHAVLLARWNEAVARCLFRP